MIPIIIGLHPIKLPQLKFFFPYPRFLVLVSGLRVGAVLVTSGIVRNFVPVFVLHAKLTVKARVYMKAPRSHPYPSIDDQAYPLSSIYVPNLLPTPMTNKLKKFLCNLLTKEIHNKNFHFHRAAVPMPHSYFTFISIAFMSSFDFPYS